MNTLPPALERYELQLEQAIRSELARVRRRRRRKLAVRLVGPLAAAGVIALGILSVLPGREPAVVRPAAAQSVVRRAIVALTPSPSSLLHVHIVGRQDNRDGSVVTWQSESWEENVAPFARRQIETIGDGHSVETSFTDGVIQLYDPAKNTIYTNPPKPHPLDFKPGPRPGTYVVRVPHVGGGFVERVIAADADDLRRLQEGLTRQRPEEDIFRTQALALLRSGQARIDRQARIDGRDAIRIAAKDGHMTYLIDAETYDPIELRTTGAGGGTTIRFRAYEQLPSTQTNRALLSLSGAHPGATVEPRPAAYAAAYKRLFPGG
jgi:hypothetical protein